MSIIQLLIAIVTSVFLYFFNGCSGPPPVTITTPMSTSKEIKVNWENHLVISKDKINYRVKYGKIKYDLPDSISLNNYFTEHEKELLGYRDSVTIRDNGMTEKQFMIIISVLR